MSKAVWLVILIVDMIAATICAINGDVATTIFNCFMGYVAFQFFKMEVGASNGQQNHP